MSGPPERSLAGRYRLLETLGRGGMGIVWRARDEYLQRDVAVKEILLPRGLDEATQADLLERFLREARAAARLDHPGIIAVYDVIAEDGLPWIVMRLVRGRSLDQTVRESGALPPERVAAIGLQMLDALEAAHTDGILHRDVTPRNVLVGADGRVVLTDFGIASIDGATALTQTGALIGSPGYMAPERLSGHSAGPESDLWSLGATLYFAVEGRPAYAAREMAAVIGMVLTREPEPALQAGPLAPILRGLLTRDPAGRPTAGQARDHLREMSEPGMPRPATPSTRHGSPPPGTFPPSQRTQPSQPATGPRVPFPDGAAKRKSRRMAPALVAGSLAIPTLAVVVGAVLLNPLRIGEGRFSSVPVTCGGVSVQTVNQMVPDAKNTGPCEWVGLGNDQGYALNVFVNRRFKRAGLHSATERAHAYLVSGSRGAGHIPVGDEGTVADDSPTTTVCFRVSNLVVKVYYTAPDPQRAHADAVVAAEQMASAIKNSGT